MGATAKYALSGIVLPPERWKCGFGERFYEGWVEAAIAWDVELAGGDISRSTGSVMATCTVIGEVARGQAVLRSRCKPGDLLYVTGPLGGAAGGLEILEGRVHVNETDRTFAADLSARLLRPTPQLEKAKYLRELGLVNSMIDISDGLSSDLEHICKASGVGATVLADHFPIDVNLKHFFSADRCLELALHGGEDFELLFSVSPEKAGQIPTSHGILIGRAASENSEISIEQDGVSRVLTPAAYRHF
jgi:thiamine-monophosphate kinase